MYRSGLAAVCPPMVSPFTFGWSSIAHERVLPSAPSSGAFESDNRTVYVAILVPVLSVIRRLWWANGDTVNAANNVDCGVYVSAGYIPGSRLVSTGSVAQGTALQIQYVDVTDTTLPPGLYWIGFGCSTTSATFFRSSVSGGNVNQDAAYRFEESAFPLPATATPAEATNSSIYLCGFATTASP